MLTGVTQGSVSPCTKDVGNQDVAGVGDGDSEEKVLFKKKLGSKLEKIKSRWDYEFSLGLRDQAMNAWWHTLKGSLVLDRLGG